MAKFNKDLHMRGCHLVSTILGDSSNMYQFVFNPDEEEFSNIYECGEGLEFELENDGTYQVVTLRNPEAVLTEDGLQIGSKIYAANELILAIESSVINVGEVEIDEILSICKLKKCLADLELNVFQKLVKNCGSVKCGSDEIRAQRDFLFVTVWLIEHYIELGNIEKAQAIYDRIKGCGSICSSLSNNKNDCGCNG